MGQEKSKLAFSKTDVELIKNSTGFDEDTIKEWYSDCPDGQLTPEAFMKIYSKCFSTGNPKEFCDHLFRTFDRDKNGYLDLKEFLIAFDMKSTGKSEEKLNWAFSMYDIDGNGYIDLDEMTEIIKSIYNMMGPNHEYIDEFASPETCAQEIFKKMDSNSDDRVTRKEFVQCCLRDPKLMKLLIPNPNPHFK